MDLAAISFRYVFPAPDWDCELIWCRKTVKSSYHIHTLARTCVRLQVCAASHVCHSFGTFYSLWHTHTHTRARAHTRTHTDTNWHRNYGLRLNLQGNLFANCSLERIKFWIKLFSELRMVAAHAQVTYQRHSVGPLGAVKIFLMWHFSLNFGLCPLIFHLCVYPFYCQAPFLSCQPWIIISL